MSGVLARALPRLLAFEGKGCFLHSRSHRCSSHRFTCFVHRNTTRQAAATHSPVAPRSDSQRKRRRSGEHGRCILCAELCHTSAAHSPRVRLRVGRAFGVLDDLLNFFVQAKADVTGPISPVVTPYSSTQLVFFMLQHEAALQTEWASSTKASQGALGPRKHATGNKQVKHPAAELGFLGEPRAPHCVGPIREYEVLFFGSSLLKSDAHKNRPTLPTKCWSVMDGEAAPSGAASGPTGHVSTRAPACGPNNVWVWGWFGCVCACVTHGLHF
jgi:hypothetical protein